MKVKNILLVLILLSPIASQGLLVVGDSGTSSAYTNGTGAGSDWDYVGHLQGSAPSSVTYISNRWFVTARHVWEGDVIGRSENSLDLGDNTYTIDTGSKVAIKNGDDTDADLCMFRVTDSAGLPTGIQSMESTPLYNSELMMIGNGYDNLNNTGMTWGDGDIYETGNGQSKATSTESGELSGRITTYFLSVYNSETTGSAYGQTYDSGGGTFVNNELAGIMVAIGSGIGDGVTYITDAGTYGAQINSIAAVPEATTGISIIGIAALFAVVKRIRSALA